MPRRDISDKTKLEALAYRLAGLDMRMAATRVGVALSTISRWEKDRTLRARAMKLYLDAIKDARARARPVLLTRHEAELIRDAKEAARVAAMPAKARHAYARKVAEEKAARKTVVVNQHPIVVLAPDDEEDESLDLATALEKLKNRFKVVETKK